jgi:hypothetical protein
VTPETWQVLVKLASQVRSKSLEFAYFSSTPQGGGVALMRHSLMRIFHLLGISARWFVTKPKPDVFDITKRKFHNVLQGVAGPDVHLTDEDIEMYETWCKDNAVRYWLEGTFKGLDVVIIDDPQRTLQHTVLTLQLLASFHISRKRIQTAKSFLEVTLNVLSLYIP